MGKDFKEITLLRFYLGNSASGAGSVSIDNVKFYEGKEIRDVTNETVNPIRNDVFTKDVVALCELKGATAVQGYSGKIFYNDLKKDTEATPYNIDDETYYGLTNTQKLAYETKLKEYALTPAWNIYYDNINHTESYFWRASEINWNGVCNGGVAAAAMAIMETDTDFCSDIISKALRSLEYSLCEVGPDGSWKEGIGYMNYYISYLTRFLSTSKEGITVSPEAKKIHELDVAETQNEFSQSENKGLYGREEADGSLLAEKLKLNVLEKNLPEESRVRISFYQAFNDSNSDNAVIAYGRKDGKCETELLGKILTFTKYGEIKLFDKTVKESYGKFIADKWYKVDLYINYGNVADGITTADLYIDNTKICENEALIQNSRIDAIINLEFDNCYVDDYAVYYVCLQNISEVSPSFGDEDYDKFLLSRKGMYIYEAENAEISDAVLSGDGIASYTESSDGDYIIVKTNDDENIYVPVYTVGKMLYENEAETQKHLFENMFGEIFTVKGRITANGTAKLFAGSDLLFETEKDANFALTFFANKKICEVYVNSELLCEKSYNDINFIEAVNGKMKNVFVYTGGITNDMRITDISVTYKRGTATGTFSAGGIRKTEGEFMIVFYKDNKLVHIYSEPVSVSGAETSYTIKQSYSGFDEARAFYMVYPL